MTTAGDRRRRRNRRNRHLLNEPLDATINDNTAYTIQVTRLQRTIEATLKGQSTAISYDTATPLGTGESGFYPDKTDVKFDNFKVYQAVVRDAHTPRIGGLVDTSISSGKLWVQGTTQGGQAIVENLSDGDQLTGLPNCTG